MRPDPDEKYFRLAVESVPNAIVMVNHAGEIVLVNSQTEELFGYGREELLGQPVAMLVPQGSRENHGNYHRGFMAQPQKRPMGSGRDLHGQRKDGTLFPVEIGLNPVEVGDGDTWVMASVVDISERRRAERMLGESDDRFRSMADSAPVMIWVSGPNKLGTFFNQEWLQFTGSSIEQALGRGWLLKVHPDDGERFYSGFSSAFDARSPFQTEYRMRRADGEYRWVLATANPRFEASGAFAGYVGCCVDIHGVKKAQEEMLTHQKMESLGQLAKGVAHDFNNLLGSVLAFAELGLAQQARNASPAEALLQIRIAAISGGEIVRQLMVYGGQDSPESEPTDLSQLVREMVQLLRVSISKQVVLKTQLEANLPPAQANPPQLRQIVMNLIMNASESIGDREGTIRVTTSRVRANLDRPASDLGNVPEGEYLKVEVCDTGSGMTQETQSRIFDPFFSTKGAGRGLGLAAVRGVVRSHGGTVNVTSSVGRGTCFEVLLPCANSRSVRKRERLPPIDKAAPVLTTVLIVEDETGLRQATAAMLRFEKFSVIEASDGASAVDLFRTNVAEIAVVLLDLTLPGLGGPGVFAEVRRIQPDVKVIVTSAYSQETVRAAFGDPRDWTFIRKPYRLTELVGLLRDTCGQGPRGLHAR
jgi:two-component system, cell cycle sensor histidine kinase and response regulator CckA